MRESEQNRLLTTYPNFGDHLKKGWHEKREQGLYCGTVAEVQALTEPELLVAEDLKEMELEYLNKICAEWKEKF